LAARRSAGLGEGEKKHTLLWLSQGSCGRVGTTLGAGLLAGRATPGLGVRPLA
jgi:hypothetical protein